MIQLLNDQGEKVITDEGEAADILVQLLDTDRNPVPADQATSILLTLYDLQTVEVINNRNNQDVQGVNGGTVEPDGRLRIRLTAADAIVKDADLPVDQTERHVARIAFSYQDSTDEERPGLDEYGFDVKKLRTPVLPTP